MRSGRLGIPLPQGPAASVIGFLQRYSACVDPAEPVPICGPAEGLAIRICGTKRPTAVTIWNSERSVTGGMLDPCRPLMEFPFAKHARSIHIFQKVEPQDGVCFDGLFEVFTVSGERISLSPMPIGLFNQKLRWVKRLAVYREIEDEEDFD